MEAEVRKKKCTRITFYRNLWKNHDRAWFPDLLWQGYKSLWGASKLSETHLEGMAMPWRFTHLQPQLWLLLLYKHTHLSFLTKSLQKHLPAFVTRQKIFPLKQANSSLVHLSLAELLSFSSHFRLIFSFPKEQNILFPRSPPGLSICNIKQNTQTIVPPPKAHYTVNWLPNCNQGRKLIYWLQSSFTAGKRPWFLQATAAFHFSKELIIRWAKFQERKKNPDQLTELCSSPLRHFQLLAKAKAASLSCSTTSDPP